MSNRPETQHGPRPPAEALKGFGQATAFRRRGPAPVHLWNPPDCGDIDMRIAADGTWFYCGSPIGRPELVRLFASILRKDGDRTVLVTPVEKVGVRVEDAPFVAVEMTVMEGAAGAALRFRTNVEDEAIAGRDHPLRFERSAGEGLKPYIRIRGDLWALVKRSLCYDLMDRGEVERVDGQGWFGVRSSGVFFPACPASEIEGL